MCYKRWGVVYPVIYGTAHCSSQPRYRNDGTRFQTMFRACNIQSLQFFGNAAETSTYSYTHAFILFLTRVYTNSPPKTKVTKNPVLSKLYSRFLELYADPNTYIPHVTIRTTPFFKRLITGQAPTCTIEHQKTSANIKKSKENMRCSAKRLTSSKP